MNEPNADQVATGVTQAAAAPTTSAPASVLDRATAALKAYDAGHITQALQTDIVGLLRETVVEIASITRAVTDAQSAEAAHVQAHE
ncbi:MAG: hypothetical protein ACYCUI_09690 [Vulcanimicrobiaceae bacterium]